MIALNVCISGFTQGPGQGHGVFRLSEQLMLAGHNRDAHRRVWYLRWNEDWRKWANHVELIAGMHNRDVLVAVHAYSWGAGWGAMEFARYLRRRGIGVPYMVLSDPVYRSRLVSFRWQSLLGRDLPFFDGPTIRVPSNVGEVWSFHQTINRPAGHRLLPENGTIIHPSVRLLREHGAMDQAPEFHEQAAMVAYRVAAEADAESVSGRYAA